MTWNGSQYVTLTGEGSHENQRQKYCITISSFTRVSLHSSEKNSSSFTACALSRDSQPFATNDSSHDLFTSLELAHLALVPSIHFSDQPCKHLATNSYNIRRCHYHCIHPGICILAPGSHKPLTRFSNHDSLIIHMQFSRVCLPPM